MIKSRENIAWAAGLIDGEGSILAREMRPDQWAIAIQVGMTDLSPLQFLKTMWGGNIYQDKHQRFTVRTGHRWVISSKSAIPVLEETLPYLRVKDDQAIVALIFQRRISNRMGRSKRGKGYSILPSEKIRRRKLAMELKSLKRKVK